MKPQQITILPTEDELNYQENPLWIRIENYGIDDAKAVIPFSKKIAQTEGWNAEFTKRAIEEYKRFIYLCCISKNGASPSIAVDKVWHMHLLYTTEYWKYFCPNVLQRELHHFPNVGGVIDYNKHHDWYLETLILYIRVFKQNPPAKYWRIPIELRSYMYSEDKPLKKISIKSLILQIHPSVFYLLISFPFILSWLLSVAMPFSDIQSLQYHFILISVLIMITWIRQYHQNRHLIPDKKLLTTYNRYQLAYLTGGYENAFLLLVNDLTEGNWIAVHKTKDEYSIKFFRLRIHHLTAEADKHFINSNLLFRCINQLSNTSNFSLSELDVVLSKYLNSVSAVQKGEVDEDYYIWPIFIVMLIMMFAYYPNDEPSVFIIILDIVLVIVSMILINTWFFPVSNFLSMKFSIKKKLPLLEYDTTANQYQIITNQYNGVSSYPFFKHLGNFFTKKGSCGSVPPPTCTACGC